MGSLKPLNIGIIGTGIGLSLHAHTFKNLPNCKIAGFASSSVVEAELATKVLGDGKAYEDWKKLIYDPDVDLVCVTVPNNLRFTVTKAAINAGKHVLVDVPLTTDIKETKTLIEISKQQKNITIINNQLRYLPAFREIKKLLFEGKLGEIQLLEIRQHLSINVKDITPKFRQLKIAGGELIYALEMQIIDLALYFLGEPDSVSVSSKLKGNNNTVDQSTYQFMNAHIRWGKINVQLTTSLTSYDEIPFSVAIYSEFAFIHYSEKSGLTIKAKPNAPIKHKKFGPIKQDIYRVAFSYYANNIVKGITQNKPDLLSQAANFHDSVPALMILNAILQSDPINKQTDLSNEVSKQHVLEGRISEGPVRGFHYHKQYYSAMFNEVVKYLTNSSALTGFPEHRFPIVEYYQKDLEDKSSGGRNYIFTDRKNRLLTLSSNAIFALSKFVRWEEADKIPPALSTLKSIFRYRRKKYRAFHQYCIFQFYNKNEFAAFSQLINHQMYFLSQFPSDQWEIMVTDYYLLDSILEPYMSKEEGRTFLYNLRFNNKNFWKIKSKIPVDKLKSLQFLLEAKPIDIEQFDHALYNPTNEYRYRFDQLINCFKGHNISVKISFNNLAMADLANGFYFYLNHKTSGKSIADGGQFVLEGLPDELSCLGMAYGVEQITELLLSKRDNISYYIYPITVEEKIIQTLAVAQKKLENKQYCIDFISKNIKQAMMRASANNYSFFIPIGEREVEGEVFSYPRNSDSTFDQEGIPLL